MSLTFRVPPGIGDFSAMYSKLCGIDRDIIIEPSIDYPHRAIPFLNILPKVKAFGYGAFGCALAIGQTLNPGTDLGSLPHGEYFLSINEWLENGGTVEDWIPGPTNYHYDMNIPEHDIKAAQETIERISVRKFPLIGVYCSAYGNSRHWGFWGPQEWIEFLRGIAERFNGKCHFIFIGAEYDLGISEVIRNWMLEQNEGANQDYYHTAYLIGQHEIGATIEIIRHLDYFFAFPSGLGFLADVVNTRHTMWFPKNLDLMRYTFTDPSNRDTVTRHDLFMSPEDALKRFSSLEEHVWQRSA